MPNPDRLIAECERAALAYGDKTGCAPGAMREHVIGGLMHTIRTLCAQLAGFEDAPGYEVCVDGVYIVAHVAPAMNEHDDTLELDDVTLCGQSVGALLSQEQMERIEEQVATQRAAERERDLEAAQSEADWFAHEAA